MAVDPTIANLDGIAFRTRLVERGLITRDDIHRRPSTGLSNATQSFKRFLVTGRQASLEQVLQHCLIGSG